MTRYVADETGAPICADCAEGDHSLCAGPCEGDWCQCRCRSYEAARAYDAAARRLFGAYAALNFPEPGERSGL